MHTAAIPQPIHNPPHVVFGNNLLSTFNVLEAAIACRGAAPRQLLQRDGAGISLRTPCVSIPTTCRSTRSIRSGPQDPYATAKWFGELLCDRAVERADIRCTSIRPCWVQDEGSYERNLGPIVRDPSVLIENYCSYVDVYDLCDAVVLAIETDLPGHEVFYVASPDTIGGHPLVETVRAALRRRGDRVPPARATGRVGDLVGQGGAPARLVGAARAWRDYLDDEGRRRA